MTSSTSAPYISNVTKTALQEHAQKIVSSSSKVAINVPEKLTQISTGKKNYLIGFSSSQTDKENHIQYIITPLEHGFISSDCIVILGSSHDKDTVYINSNHDTNPSPLISLYVFSQDKTSSIHDNNTSRFIDITNPQELLSWSEARQSSNSTPDMQQKLKKFNTLFKKFILTSSDNPKNNLFNKNLATSMINRIKQSLNR